MRNSNKIKKLKEKDIFEKFAGAMMDRLLRGKTDPEYEGYILQEIGLMPFDNEHLKIYRKLKKITSKISNFVKRDMIVGVWKTDFGDPELDYYLIKDNRGWVWQLVYHQ